MGPHLLAPTGSDFNRFGTLGTVLAGYVVYSFREPSYPLCVFGETCVFILSSPVLETPPAALSCIDVVVCHDAGITMT